MVVSVVCFFAHFLYFSGQKEAYYYMDIILQFAGYGIFPAYYVYFRLLTVDSEFSVKSHFKYFVPSFFVALIYALAALLAPNSEYQAFLFDHQAYPDSPYIDFLRAYGIVLRVYFFILVIVTYSANYSLLKRYGAKAEQFYSDVNDGKFNNGKMLNYSILFMCIGALIAFAFGRFSLFFQEKMVYILWTIFSVTVYIMGYMGMKQKLINPTYDLDTNGLLDTQLEELLSPTQEYILQKLQHLFNESKIYLNPQLNILEVVNTVGTNRTYLSSLINQHYNQNFSSFVNDYRIEELSKVIYENPGFSNEMLIKSCGFGSLSSLKRAVFLKTGLSFSQWKDAQLLLKSNNI